MHNGAYGRRWRTVKLKPLGIEEKPTLPLVAAVPGPSQDRNTEEIIMPRRHKPIRIELNLADWWIGLFWRRDERRRLHIWVSFLCVTLHIQP